MGLSAGTRLGPYGIVAPLGAGGMGEVYRARDPRLGRDVAVKVLPPDVAQDADRRARFERQARAVAALSQGVVWLTDVSSDGKWLLYMALGSGTAGDIWALPLSGEPKPVPWLQSPAHEVFARFSPDGRWIAFVQRESDGYAVYLDAFPTRGQRQRVSPGTGQRPMWSSDGRRLFYLTSEFRMMEVQVTPAPEGVRVSPPVELFRAPTPNTTIERVVFWPSPDGQRFLYVARQDDAIPRTINIVLDWPALVSAPIR